MKIDVDPHVLQQIAAYCDEQQAVMQSTRDYLNVHTTLNLHDTGFLLALLTPFHDLCRSVTMAGFSMGQQLVKSRAEAVHDYLKEQTEMEHQNTAFWGNFGMTGQNGSNFGNGGNPMGGGFGGLFGTPGNLGNAGNAGNHSEAGSASGSNAGNAGNASSVGGAVGGVGAAAGGIEQSPSEQGLNPQPLPPGPPDATRMEALADREVMDKVWQQRSDEDALGRSPAQLQALWADRQPVEPPPPGGLESREMQMAMDRQEKVLANTANIMKIVSNSQMAALGNLKSN